MLRFCRARDLSYIFGVAPTSTLRKHVIALEASTAARAEQTPGEKVRRFKEFNDGAISWDRVERIIARVEAGPLGGRHPPKPHQLTFVSTEPLVGITARLLEPLFRSRPTETPRPMFLL